MGGSGTLLHLASSINPISSTSVEMPVPDRVEMVVRKVERMGCDNY
jgi:hypothetical protein